MMRAALNPQSGNEKTGEIITWETSSDTCPPTCGQYKRCYAKFGYLRFHWVKLDLGKRGFTFPVFLDRLLDLPPGGLARGNQWGDQPGDGQALDIPAFRALVARVGRFRSWSFSHYPLTPETVREFRSSAVLGYTVNVSCDSLEDLDRKALTRLPVVVTVEHEAGCTAPKDDCKCRKVERSPGGIKVVICPAQTIAGMTCKKCGDGNPLCYRAERNYAIGFRVHGPGRKLKVIQ